MAPTRSLESDKLIDLPPSDTRSKQNEKKIVWENKAMKGARYGYDFVDLITMAIILKASSMMMEDVLFSCEISKEDGSSGKFDDIVFRYTFEGSRTILKIQVKHRTKTKTVSLQELMETSSTEPFALIKYFKSFHEQYTPSNDKQIFVLCTNTQMKNEVERFLEKLHPNDVCNIFDPIGATYYRFRRAGPHKTNCIANALKKASESYRLAEILASHIYSQKELVLYTKNLQRNPLLSKYNNAIVRHMMEYSGEGGAFYIKQTFRTNTDPAVANFRKQFENSYQEIANRALKKNTQDFTAEGFDVYVDIAKKGIKTNDPKKLIEQIIQNDIRDHFPTDIITDEDVNLFFDKFLIACDTVGTNDLPSKIAEFWKSSNIYEQTNLVCSLETEKYLEGMHRTVSNWMRSSSNLPTILEAKHVEEIIKKVKLHQKYLLFKNTSNKYIADHLKQFLKAKSESLMEKPLYKFLAPSDPETNAAKPNIFTFSTLYNLQFTSMIVLQTFLLLDGKLNQIVFIDANTIEKENQIILDMCKLFEDSLVMVIDCGAYLPSDLNQLKQKLSQSIDANRDPRLKIVLLGKHQRNIFCQDFCFKLKDFEESSIKKLIEANGWNTLFGTSMPVEVFMHENDDVSMILNFIEDQHKEPLKLFLVDNYYDNIRDSYVHRRIQYDSNESDEVDKFWIFKELPSTTESKMVPWNSFYETIHKKYSPNDTDDVERLKAGLENKVAHKLPGDEAHWQEKVHILLGEAGCGKSSYFNWLGCYLQDKDRSSWVIRFNAIDYSIDFECLSSEPLNATEVMRFFYRMIHQTLFRRIYQTTPSETDTLRREAEQCANLLDFNGNTASIKLDEGKCKSTDMKSLHLIMVRLFEEKYNQHRLVILFDGFDEILPNYKDVTSNLLTQFRAFEGVERMYLTSRPYDIKQNFRNIFPSARFHSFVHLSYADALTVLNLFMKRNFSQYSSHEIDQQICLLKILMLTIAMQLKSLYAKPMYLKMAMEILKPLIGQYVNFNDQTISASIMQDLTPKFEKLQLVEQFVKNNLFKSNFEKPGIESAIAISGLKVQMDKANKQTLRMHSILALYVIFDSSERQKLHLNEYEVHEYMDEIKRGDEKTGFIEAVFDSRPLFIHRTFAEYFAALWMFENRNRPEIKLFLKSAAYWNAFRRALRDYFDRMLVKNQGSKNNKCELIHMAFLGSGLEYVQKMLSENDEVLKGKDAGGRTILHLMAIYCPERIKDEKELFAKMLCFWPNLDEKDKVLGWTALDYALINFNEIFASALLKRGASINAGEIKDTLLACDGEEMWKRALASEELIFEIAETSNLSNVLEIYEREVFNRCLYNGIYLIDPDVRSALRKLVFEYRTPARYDMKKFIVATEKDKIISKTINLLVADLEGMTPEQYVGTMKKYNLAIFLIHFHEEELKKEIKLLTADLEEMTPVKYYNQLRILY